MFIRSNTQLVFLLLSVKKEPRRQQTHFQIVIYAKML